MNIYTIICIKWITNENLLYKKINTIKFRNQKKKKDSNKERSTEGSNWMRVREENHWPYKAKNLSCIERLEVRTPLFSTLAGDERGHFRW